PFISIALYFLNRAGYYRWAAALFIAHDFLIIYYTAVSTNDIAFLFFASFTLILAAMLLPMRASVIFFFISLATLIGINKLHPIHGDMTTFGTTLVFFVTAPTVLVFLNHRTQLEKERQEELRTANAKLRESEAVLEQRVVERTKQLEEARAAAEEA